MENCCCCCSAVLTVPQPDEALAQHGDYADCIRHLKQVIDEQAARLAEVRAALGIPV